MKKLGVVVPIYNAESTLRKCIDSIIGQTYENIEVVLVNDGSCDGSLKICKEYAKRDGRIQIINQVNQGLIMARYNGAAVLNCDYLTFVDADDWIDLYAYEKMSVYMDNDEDVVMFQIIRYFDESNQTFSKSNFPAGRYNKNDIKNIILPYMVWDIKKYDFGIDPSLCCKIIKKNILMSELERVKRLKIYYGEDSAVTYPLFQNINSLVISEECFYYHRQRVGQKIASYIEDEEFYGKLFLLYDYLKKRIGTNREICKQIDYFYVYSVNMRLRIYGDRKSRRGYVFPFDIIPVRSKIVIYGASEIGQLFYEQIMRIKYCTVVAWVDRNSLMYQHLGVKNIEQLMYCEDYDYIVIAVGKKEIANQIIKDLTSMGIDENKIVWSVR